MPNAACNCGRTSRPTQFGGVPADHAVHIALSLGYAAEGDDQSAGQPRAAVLPRVGRRGLDELVHWEQWTSRHQTCAGLA